MSHDLTPTTLRWLASMAIMLFFRSAVLPYTPASDLLGFTPLPLSFLLMLGAITILYVVISEATKRLFYRMIDQYDER
jgi:Mg2+-importing ATPase